VADALRPGECPKCGESVLVRYTVKTDRGMYCHCDRCLHMWHEEQVHGLPIEPESDE